MSEIRMMSLWYKLDAPGCLKVATRCVKSQKKKQQPGCKPGYVGRRRFPAPVAGPVLRSGRSVIYLCRVSPLRLKQSTPGSGRATHPRLFARRHCRAAGIHDLATHKTCGTPSHGGARWALTPPFHPCPGGSGAIPGKVWLPRP